MRYHEPCADKPSPYGMTAFTRQRQGAWNRLGPTLARWFTEPFRQKGSPVLDQVRTMIRTTPPRGYAGCCHAIAALNLTDHLGAITLPTLIIVGEDDPATPVAASRHPPAD